MMEPMTDYDEFTRIPEEMSVSRLMQVVRCLRERLYLSRLAQQETCTCGLKDGAAQGHAPECALPPATAESGKPCYCQGDYTNCRICGGTRKIP